MFTLIKFGKRVNMEKLYEGDVYCNPIRSFNKGILHTEDKRYDRYEGVFNVRKLGTVDLIINGNVVATTNKAELKLHYSTNYPIYCMYKLNLKPYTLNKLNEIIDPKMYEIGGGEVDTAVIITDTDKFINRITEHIGNLGVGFWNGSVAYKEDIYQEWDFFSKSIEYSHQSEYRFVLNTESHGIAYQLNIGTLNDIAEIVDLKELPNIKIKMKRNTGRLYT